MILEKDQGVNEDATPPRVWLKREILVNLVLFCTEYALGISNPISFLSHSHHFCETMRFSALLSTTTYFVPC